ncbi:MAG: DegT/DnrJ/EryC1/StrS family aminotransferase, partial [Lentisphaerae bacterium]|nr:DegT/DnrJ/EryC1/StrS family aminotransferase [Lentisphaerota bacterium]
MEKLAINDGNPFIDYKIPSWNDISGRNFGEEEKQLVLEVLESGRLGMICGTKVRELQQRWAKKCKIDTAVAVSSGTAALHTALIYACVGAGDEVLVPCSTDMGTVISVLLQNAVPVFVDVDILTQNMDAVDLESAILAVARRHGLIIVEDCCQAHFAEYKGKIVGTIGDAGCFSFQQTKHITSGEGGMVITNGDSRYGRKLQLCGDKGWPREKYRDHYFLAPNYHLTDLQAAVALPQLSRIEQSLEARRRSAAALTKILTKQDGVTPPPEPDGYKHTYFAYQFIIDPGQFSVDRDTLVKAICAEGLPIIPSYLPMPLYRYDFLQNIKMYNETRCPVVCGYYEGHMDYTKTFCRNGETACKVGFFLPWNEKITESQAQDMGNAIVKVLR